MTYFAILSLVVVVALLYQARGVIGVILADAKFRTGDTQGAIRRLRWASFGKIEDAVILHKHGLILALAGCPAEAVACYRKALDLVDAGSPYPRPRLLASMGFALIDLARYADAERCFLQAIEAGDKTGNAQERPKAELRLMQGVEPEKALAFTEEAIEQASHHRPDGRIPGSYYALQAWALALLNRIDEAEAAIAKAEQSLEPAVRTGASRHWRMGMALLAMQQPEAAREHFRQARALDPHGKYGLREHAAQTLPPGVSNHRFHPRASQRNSATCNRAAHELTYSQSRSGFCTRSRPMSFH